MPSVSPAYNRARTNWPGSNASDGLPNSARNWIVPSLVSTVDGSVTALLSAHQSIGVPQPLKLFGTEEQKKRYFPRLAKGAISAFALTESGVGSDPAAMETTAVPTEDGQAFVLNGEKLWCTNGTVAELLVAWPHVEDRGTRAAADHGAIGYDCRAWRCAGADSWA